MVASSWFALNRTTTPPEGSLVYPRFTAIWRTGSGSSLWSTDSPCQKKRSPTSWLRTFPRTPISLSSLVVEMVTDPCSQLLLDELSHSSFTLWHLMRVRHTSVSSTHRPPPLHPPRVSWASVQVYQWLPVLWSIQLSKVRCTGGVKGGLAVLEKRCWLQVRKWTRTLVLSSQQ